MNLLKLQNTYRMLTVSFMKNPPETVPDMQMVQECLSHAQKNLVQLDDLLRLNEDKEYQNELLAEITGLFVQIEATLKRSKKALII